MAAQASRHPTERFQLDSESGPPPGALNIHPEGDLPADQRSRIGTTAAGSATVRERRPFKVSTYRPPLELLARTVRCRRRPSPGTRTRSPTCRPASSPHLSPHRPRTLTTSAYGPLHARASASSSSNERNWPSRRARPALGGLTKAATFRATRPSATAKASIERSVDRYRLAVDPDRPAATSPPAHAETWASVIEAIGRWPNLGATWFAHADRSASCVFLLRLWREATQSGKSDASGTLPRRGSNHSPERSRRACSCSHATASDLRSKTRVATSRPWDFTRARYRTRSPRTNRWMLTLPASLRVEPPARRRRP